jgi:malonyl-CoA decarboxylase
MTAKSSPFSANELEVLCRTSEALLSITSDASAVALAELVVRRYRALKPSSRNEFFFFLLNEMGASRSQVDQAIDEYQSEPSELSLLRLFQAVEPRRQALFRAINMAPGGTETVMTMRADVLALLAEHPELTPVEADLLHVLSSWFNRGFIVLERISWQSPGAVLEKLIAYEAVHEIRGWDDLRRRLAEDRRCFAFFHPAIPNEPLIFIEVALTHGLASSIQAVLDEPDPDDEGPTEDTADTATFYSITNCQPGLQGIPFGNFLIKQVVRELASGLASELAGELTTFATLSPVPGLGPWLETARHTNVFDPAERRTLRLLDDPSWHEDPAQSAALEPILRRACAIYLVDVKRGWLPADPVARFHLRNGARLERINWLADISDQGLRQSVGILVNYLYDEADIDSNHDAFVSEGVVAHSAAVDQLLQRREPSRERRA